jgi:SSS family solute:Na+ symporter
MFVCTSVGLIVAFTTGLQKQVVGILKKNSENKISTYSLIGISIIIFIIVLFDLAPLSIQFLGVLILISSTAIISTYFIDYDPIRQTEGLTVWSVGKAKELFKGSRVNDLEGEKILVDWKIKEGEDETANFSKNDMAKMNANVGDLIYLCDARKYLGGLKSVHLIYGEMHDEDGIVYINNEALLNGVFEKNRKLTAEKEM